MLLREKERRTLVAFTLGPTQLTNAVNEPINDCAREDRVWGKKR